MAETKKIVIQAHNGTDFDTYYPETTAEQVIESAGKRFVSDDKIAEWDGKADQSLLGTAATKNTGTAAGNVPILDSNGKLNSLVLPAIAITDTFVVSSEAEMLALTAEKGDVAVRHDEKMSFILRGTDPSVLSDWEFLEAPTDGVQSINGRKGVVTLTKADVGLDKVENKTVEEILTDAILKGVPTAPTPAQTSNNTTVATTAFVKTAIAAIEPGPGGGVESVNGRTGAVTLTKADVGLDKVENKNVAEILTNPTLTGTATAPAPTPDSNDQTIATTAFVKTQVAAASGTKIVVSATQPANLNIGDFWYKEV